MNLLLFLVYAMKYKRKIELKHKIIKNSVARLILPLALVNLNSRLVERLMAGLRNSNPPLVETVSKGGENYGWICW